MKKRICDMLELNKAPMLAIEKNIVTAANIPARMLLGEDIVGRSAVGLLPEQLLMNFGTKFTASALINDQSFSADVQRSGSNIYVSLTDLSAAQSPSDYISDFLMNSLLSDLFTLGISINNSMQTLDKLPMQKLQHNFQIMNRNYFSLRRSLQNLHSALQLRKNTLYICKRPEDICQICSETASTLERLELQTGVNLSFSTPLPSLICNIDRSLTERVLMNILCNSYAASSPGSSIQIHLAKHGEYAVITVEDDGCGIPASTMANIFTRYETPVTLENLRQGSTGGLGLSISRGIVEKHGGSIIIESRSERGTCVRILLPIQPDILRLESTSIPAHAGGMDRILTEFAPILDCSLYSREYLD